MVRSLAEVALFRTIRIVTISGVIASLISIGTWIVVVANSSSQTIDPSVNNFLLKVKLFRF